MQTLGQTDGFTLIEMVITLVILGILIFIGVPQMSTMLGGAKAGSIVEFYIEGLRMARNGAVQINGAARITLSANAANGQYDWKIDWCIPSATVPCSDTTGTWTTTASTTPAPSVFRSASSLPASSQYAISITPANASVIYYNSLGWVNTNVNPRILQLDISGANVTGQTAIKILLSGLPVHCDPNAAAPDSRACP